MKLDLVGLSRKLSAVVLLVVSIGPGVELAHAARSETAGERKRPEDLPLYDPSKTGDWLQEYVRSSGTGLKQQERPAVPPTQGNIPCGKVTVLPRLQGDLFCIYIEPKADAGVPAQYFYPLRVNGRPARSYSREALVKLFSEPPDTGRVVKVHGFLSYGRFCDLKLQLFKSDAVSPVQLPRGEQVKAVQNEFGSYLNRIDQHSLTSYEPVSSVSSRELLDADLDIFARAAVSELVDKLDAVPEPAVLDRARAFLDATLVLALLGDDRSRRFRDLYLSEIARPNSELNLDSVSDQELLTALFAPAIVGETGSILERFSHGCLDSEGSPSRIYSVDCKNFVCQAYGVAIDNLLQENSPQRLKLAHEFVNRKTLHLDTCPFLWETLGDTFLDAKDYRRALFCYRKCSLGTLPAKVSVVQSPDFTRLQYKKADMLARLNDGSGAAKIVAETAKVLQHRLSRSQLTALEGGIGTFATMADLRSAAIALKGGRNLPAAPRYLYLDTEETHKRFLLLQQVTRAIAARKPQEFNTALASLKRIYDNQVDYGSFVYFKLRLFPALLNIARQLSDSGYITESKQLLEYLSSKLKAPELTRSAGYLLRCERFVNSVRSGSGAGVAAMRSALALDDLGEAGTLRLLGACFSRIGDYGRAALCFDQSAIALAKSKTARDERTGILLSFDRAILSNHSSQAGPVEPLLQNLKVAQSMPGYCDQPELLQFRRSLASKCAELSDCYLKRGKSDDAVALLEATLANAKWDATAPADLFSFDFSSSMLAERLACIYFDKQDYGKSYRLLKKAATASGDAALPSLSYNLARAAMHEKDYATAADSYRKFAETYGSMSTYVRFADATFRTSYLLKAFEAACLAQDYDKAAMCGLCGSLASEMQSVLPHPRKLLTVYERWLASLPLDSPARAHLQEMRQQLITELRANNL